MNTLKLIDRLSAILHNIVENEQYIDSVIEEISDHYKLSAKNLYRYLILRSYDLREYHDSLSELGVSSLRSAEGYVYSNLYNVIRNLHLISGKRPCKEPQVQQIGFRKSRKLLKKHANQLFNAVRGKHFTEIMVTLPTEAADDKTIIHDMAMCGMEIARINMSHDDHEVWLKMVNIIREVESETGKKIKIYMDLAGPKIRTANIKVDHSSGQFKDGFKVRTGEHLILTKRQTSGKRSIFGENNEQLEKAEIGVMLPEIIDDIKLNDVVYFDDGMIHASVVAKGEDFAELIITKTYKPKLSSQKGINLPQTKLNLPSLTEQDLINLPFVVKYADIVGYSFVRNGEDVMALYNRLKAMDAEHLGIVFKIENEEAFNNLPQILLAGMRHDKIGVMIARGDLAVEIGFERISEVQNQILWICEAAHIPVIWATQVLDNLAKTGIPTRAEVSDAAYAANAECVMLNKGPFINDAITTLKNILIRMEGHSFKKKSSLRALSIAKNALSKFNKKNKS